MATARGALGFQWHLSHRCDGRCRHCYQQRFDAAAELEVDELCRLAERLAAACPGPLTIHLTGGEPLLLPGFDRLLAHLDGFGRFVELHVITSGTVIDPSALAALAGTERLRTIKVSVESADPGINDRIRGPGHLARAAEGICRLREATGKDVITMATLGRHNAAGIPRLARWSRDLGAAAVILERFVPIGTGRTMAAEALDHEGWEGVIAVAARLAGLEADADELRRYQAFRLDFDAGGAISLAGAECHLGGEAMALMPDGTVYPCRRLPRPMGNVRFEPVEEILERLERFAESAGASGRPGCRAMEAAREAKSG